MNFNSITKYTEINWYVTTNHILIENVSQSWNRWLITLMRIFWGKNMRSTWESGVKQRFILNKIINVRKYFLLAIYFWLMIEGAVIYEKSFWVESECEWKCQIWQFYWGREIQDIYEYFISQLQPQQRAGPCLITYKLNWVEIQITRLQICLILK